MTLYFDSALFKNDARYVDVELWPIKSLCMVTWVGMSKQSHMIMAMFFLKWKLLNIFSSDLNSNEYLSVLDIKGFHFLGYFCVLLPILCRMSLYIESCVQSTLQPILCLSYDACSAF